MISIILEFYLKKLPGCSWSVLMLKAILQHLRSRTQVQHLKSRKSKLFKLKSWIGAELWAWAKLMSQSNFFRTTESVVPTAHPVQNSNANQVRNPHRGTRIEDASTRMLFLESSGVLDGKKTVSFLLSLTLSHQVILTADQRKFSGFAKILLFSFNEEL